MELSEEPELLQVPSECLGVDVVVGSKVNRVLELRISNCRLRVVVASLHDNTHVGLSYSEDLLIILLASSSRNDAERDTHIVPGISLDSLVRRNIDRFNDVGSGGANCEGKVDVFSQLA